MLIFRGSSLSNLWILIVFEYGKVEGEFIALQALKPGFGAEWLGILKLLVYVWLFQQRELVDTGKIKQQFEKFLSKRKDFCSMYILYENERV